MNDIENLFQIIINRKPNTEEENRFKNISKENLIKFLGSYQEKFRLLKEAAVISNSVKTRVVTNEEDIRDFYSTNKYKVAICLSGHLRDYKTNLNSINKYLVKPLNADVFIHTWDSIGTQKRIVQSTVGPVPDESNKLTDDYINYITNIRGCTVDNNQTYLNSIEKLLSSKKFYLYGQDLGNEFYGGSAEPKYIFSQLYSVYRSYKVLEKYCQENNKKYDIVIKLRADYKLYSGINISDFEVLQQYKKLIFVPSLPYSNHGHPSCCLCLNDVKHEEHIEDICDVFAYSNQDNMKKYMSVYNDLFNIREIFEAKNNDLHNIIFNQLDYKNLVLVDIWKKLNYSVNCFYPERIFREYLKEYLIKPSKLCGEVLRV